MAFAGRPSQDQRAQPVAATAEHSVRGTVPPVAPATAQEVSQVLAEESHGPNQTGSDRRLDRKSRPSVHPRFLDRGFSSRDVINKLDAIKLENRIWRFKLNVLRHQAYLRCIIPDIPITIN